MPNCYKDNVIAELRSVLSELGPLHSAIDVGAGDGYYAARLMEQRLVEKITPVEVQARAHSEIEPVLYDGTTLPFAERSFELSYAIDVIHHSTNPPRTLQELARVSSRYLLLKDHTYDSPVGYAFLCLLDEIGNRRFGVPSRYRYQRGWEWSPVLERAGFRLQRLIHPARCEEGLLGRLVNPLQFVALWRRADASEQASL
jgi:SAM-dependent methyltransferase